jgi:hypothetical protein
LFEIKKSVEKSGDAKPLPNGRSGSGAGIEGDNKKSK